MIYRSNRPWIAQQVWKDVLFLHWPIPSELIQAQLPAPFKVDTYDGKSWITIVLFQALHSRPRGMPRFLSQRNLLQVNTRTYVRFNGVPGVYFLSLDTNSKWTVYGARSLYNLPYRKATMNFKRDDHGMQFESKTANKSIDFSSFKAQCRPTLTQVDNQPDSLAHFLTERYYLWTIKNKQILKGSISHHPWDLVCAESQHKMGGRPSILVGEDLNEQPIAHYSESIHAYMHPFERVGIFDQSE